MCVAVIKEKLRNNPDILIQILEELGCHHIKQIKSDEIRGAVPDGITDTSLCIKINGDIWCKIFSRSDFEGEI